jgi:hypothetical protein
MRKTAFFLFLSIYSIHTDAMDFIVEKKSEQIKNFSMPATFCAILKQHIFTIPSFCLEYPCLKDATVTISALAQTNRFLNKFINDDDKTLALIKQLSQQFDCSHIDVSRALCTNAANNRFALQKAFLVGWNHGFDLIEDDINKLKRMGLDLNFGYCKKCPTALMQTAGWQEVGYSNIAVWLIENGADITLCTPVGINASMIALAHNNWPLIDTLLDHPAFDAIHCDIENSTPLHCYFYGLMRDVVPGLGTNATPSLRIVKKLLEKGANPTIMNKDEKTPLDLAKESGYQSLIELLEKATADFNFKKNADSVCCK